MKNTINRLPRITGYQSVDLSSDDIAVGPGRSAQTHVEIRQPAYIKAGGNVLRLSLIGRQAHPEHGDYEDIFEVENLSSPDNDARMTITEQTVVGRQTTPELQLDDTASRSHLKITPMASAVLISDLDSTNSTVVQAVNLKTDYTLVNQPIPPNL